MMDTGAPAALPSTAIALEGGEPVRSSPLPPWPYFAPDEIEAVRSVLVSGRANYWTGGECASFEAEFARYVGSKYAVALANGSVALELALYALGVGPGDDVVVPARSFMATASCVVLRGARPIFADVDAVSGNLSAQSVEAVLTERTRAVIAVHLGGWPCDMDPLLDLARTRGFAVIEDCAQAHGARYDGRRVGSMGILGCFSFYPTKNLGAIGDGDKTHGPPKLPIASEDPDQARRNITKMKVIMKWWNNSITVARFKTVFPPRGSSGNNLLLFTASMGRGIVINKNVMANALNITSLSNNPKKRWA